MKLTPERIDEIKVHVRSFGLAAIIGGFADLVTKEGFRPIQIFGWGGGALMLMGAVWLTKKKG